MKRTANFFAMDRPTRSGATRGSALVSGVGFGKRVARGSRVGARLETTRGGEGARAETGGRDGRGRSRVSTFQVGVASREKRTRRVVRTFRDERPVLGGGVRRHRPRENVRGEFHFLGASGFARGLDDSGRDRARIEPVSLRSARRKARGGFDSRERPSAAERLAAMRRARAREGRGGDANGVCERGGHRREVGTRAM